MGLVSQPLFAQESIIKEYASENKKKAYAFYPSTLRMVNLKNNEAYNEMISEINKLLVYMLDSSATASRSYTSVIDSYKEEGFEPYAEVWGKLNIYIYGKEGRKRQIVGVYGEEDRSFAFYLDGRISWQKIPTLIQTLESNDMLNLFEINNSGHWHDD